MSVDAPSRIAERTLSSEHLHRRWEARYHVSGNERFHDEALRVLLDSLSLPPGAKALDAGCGPGLHSVRLARQGLSVCAADFAPPALARARENAAAAGVDDRVNVRREDLLDLSFADRSFDVVLSWGVLIHVPEVERALEELCRVVAPGGALVLCEGNTRSLDTTVARLRGLELTHTPAGLERWEATAAGPLMVREADVGWLVRTIEAFGLRARRPRAGELTEWYVHVPDGSRRERAIHAINRFWFHRVRSWLPATGVFVIADRTAE